MEASLMPYCQGAIALYDPPYAQEHIDKYHLYPKHPVLIASRNFSETTFEYMVFPITSKIDKYCGYRIFINNNDAGDSFNGKMSVIRTDVMQCIDRRHLSAVFGYAPPELVDKCLKAYAWHIGLSTTMPEYILEDQRRYDYTTAGEANVVHNSSRIEGDIACHGYRMDPATGLPRTFHPRDFVPKPIGGLKARNDGLFGAFKKLAGASTLPPKVDPVEDALNNPPALPPAPLESPQGENTPEGGAKPKPKVFDMPPEPQTLREKIDATKLNPLLLATSESSVPQRAIMRNRKVAYESKINMTKDVIEEVKKIPIAYRFRIYTATISELAFQHDLNFNAYKAKKMRLATIRYITEGIERILPDIQTRAKNCKFFINDEDILFLRCMMPYELRYGKIGSDFYWGLMKDTYEVDFSTQTVTGLISEYFKRKGKSMPSF